MIKFKIFVTIIVAALFIAPMTGFGADPASKPVVAVTPVNISPAEAEDVAALIKDLGSKDNSIRSRALENLSKLGARGVPPIIEAFMNTNSLVRKGAAEVLGNIGNVAPEVVTALVKALLDRDAYVRKSASDALGKIGAPVIPDIMKMLTDNDSNARKGAAEALGNIGNVTPAVAPNLIKTLEDVDGSVRKSAVEALGRIGSATPEVIPALISKVEDPDSNVRKSVAESLEKLNAMTAELKIKYCMLDLGDDNGDVRKRAVDVLSKVDPVTPEVTAAIIKALEDKDYSVRKSSAEYLEKRGAMTAALKATRHIIDLKSGNNAVRIRAAEALGNIGATTSEVIPALINALEDKDVRDAAIEALGNIGASAKSAVPALIKALADGDSNVRMMSAEALGKIGPSAKSAVPTLIKVLKDSDSAVREKAADALKKIGEMTLIRKVTYSIFTNPFITVLTIIGVCVALFFAAWYMTPLIWRIFLPLGWYMRELHNLNDKRRSAAVQALAKIGKPAVPALINVLKHKNKNIRISAATALNKIGLPLSQKEVPVVLEALRDKEREVRKNITEILGNAGPVTVEVIPALIKVLEDGDGYVRVSAAEALGKNKSGIPMIIPPLMKALGDSLYYVRDSAAEALEKCGAMTVEMRVKRCIADSGDGHSHIRDRALEDIGNIGPAAISELMKTIGNGNSYVRRFAFVALEKLGALTVELKIKRYILDLSDNHTSVQTRATEALGNMGAAASEAIPHLIKLLGNKDYYSRWHAAEALGKLGALTPEIEIRKYILDLGDSNNEVRSKAADALCVFGPDAKEALPKLKKLLAEDDEIVRASAENAISKIESPSDSTAVS